MHVYTGDTQRLTLHTNDPATFLLNLFAQAPQADATEQHDLRRRIEAQAEILRAASSYIQAARMFLDNYAQFQATAEQHPNALPPSIAAFLQEVQR